MNILCLNGVNPLKNVEGVKVWNFWSGRYNNDKNKEFCENKEHMLWMPPAFTTKYMVWIICCGGYSWEFNLDTVEHYWTVQQTNFTYSPFEGLN